VLRPKGNCRKVTRPSAQVFDLTVSQRWTPMGSRQKSPAGALSKTASSTTTSSSWTGVGTVAPPAVAGAPFQLLHSSPVVEEMLADLPFPAEDPDALAAPCRRFHNLAPMRAPPPHLGLPLVLTHPLQSRRKTATAPDGLTGRVRSRHRSC